MAQSCGSDDGQVQDVKEHAKNPVSEQPLAISSSPDCLLHSPSHSVRWDVLRICGPDCLLKVGRHRVLRVSMTIEACLPRFSYFVSIVADSCKPVARTFYARE
jgi:hypothetical protein